MHELSLALEVIELVQREADQRRITSVQEILIEVGDLSGVEADAFQSALELLVNGSILETTVIQIQRTPGKGRCTSCDKEIDMNHRLSVCPDCLRFPSEISGGDEFRVVSLVPG